MSHLEDGKSKSILVARAFAASVHEGNWREDKKVCRKDNAGTCGNTEAHPVS